MFAAKHKTIGSSKGGRPDYYFKEVSQARDLFRQCLDECPDDRLARVYADRCEQFLSTGVLEGTGEVDLAVQWGPGIEIGHAIIDEQHRQLFASVNAFTDTIKKDRDFSHAGPIIDFLDEYVQIHFETEESIMEMNGYPFMDVQKEQHQRFFRRLTSLKREIEEDTDWHFLLFKIQVLLVDWLVHHTCKADRHLGKFLRLEKTTE